MKSIIIKTIFILIVLMLLLNINSKVFAWSEIIQDGKDFINQADSSKANIDTSELQGVSGYLYNILLAAGVVIAVIVATVLGLQFMLGGAEGQAKVKEMVIPFVVGCVIVFGGFGFWKIALTLGEQFEGVSTSTSSEQTYERNEDGEPVCRNCGEVLSAVEQRRGVCSECGERTGI